MEHKSDASPLLVVTKDGYSVDLEPLVEAAKSVKRNALLDAEFDGGTGATPMMVATFQMGMRVAVEKILGEESAQAFDEWVIRAG